MNPAAGDLGLPSGSGETHCVNQPRPVTLVVLTLIYLGESLLWRPLTFVRCETIPSLPCPPHHVLLSIDPQKSIPHHQNEQSSLSARHPRRY